MTFLIIVLVVVALYVLFVHKFNVNGVEYKGWIAKNKAEKEGNVPAGYNSQDQYVQQNQGRGAGYDDKRMTGSAGIPPVGNGNSYSEQPARHGKFYTFAIEQPSPEGTAKLTLVKALIDNKKLLGFGPDFGLKESKDFVDSIPEGGDKIVVENVSEKDFEAVKNIFLGLVAFSVTEYNYE